MKLLVIDTETTGVFDFKRPADDAGQPRMASIAMLYFDGIEQPEPTHTFERYIRPDGWRMDPKAGAVNGLTDEFLTQHGVAIAEALDAYEAALDQGYVVVAYNAQFDLKMLRAEMRRAGRDDRFDRTMNICVMRPMTSICQIPGPYGYKWPKLSEACAHFGITNEKAHDAVGDAWAAARVMQSLHAIGALPDAAVHYAKNRP